MLANRSSRVERRCASCGRVAIITFGHRPSGMGKRRELPVSCPYEDCGRTMVQAFAAGVDLQGVIVRQHDGARPPRA